MMQMNTVNSGQRFDWCDCAKGLCIFFVVLMHVQKPTIYSRICVPFFLSTFFFVSGYLFDGTKGIRKSVAKMLKCCAIYGLLTTVLQYILMGKSLLTWNPLGAILQIPTHPTHPDAILWFLPCMIASKVIFYYLHKLAKNDKWFILLEVVTSSIGAAYIGIVRKCLPWHLQTACFTQGFMLLGFLLRKYERQFEEYESIALPFLTIAYFSCVFLLPMDADLCTLFFTSFTLYCIQALLGTLFFVLIVRNMTNIYIYISNISEDILFFSTP